MPGWVEFLLNGVCHRLPAHSLVYGGQPAPLCARCTGLFAGAALLFAVLAASGLWRRSRLAPWHVQGGLVALALWWALDGLNALGSELLGRPLLYEPSNSLRLFTGLGMAIVLVTELWPLAASILARVPQDEPAIETGWDLAGMVAMAGAAGYLLLSNRLPWGLVALWSVSGVVALFGVANVVLVALLAHWSGVRLRGWRLAVACSGGLALAAAEMASMAALSHMLVG